MSKILLTNGPGTNRPQMWGGGLQVLAGGDPLDRPSAVGSSACPAAVRVRMNTIRSPFLPEILARSSGFVVFGRSSRTIVVRPIVR